MGWKLENKSLYTFDVSAAIRMPRRILIRFHLRAVRVHQEQDVRNSKFRAREIPRKERRKRLAVDREKRDGSRSS